MNDPLPNYFLLLNMIFLFFFASSLSFEKRKRRTNLKINLNMHYTQVSFIWIKRKTVELV